MTVTLSIEVSRRKQVVLLWGSIMVSWVITIFVLIQSSALGLLLFDVFPAPVSDADSS
jgi:hypothetical protein